MLVVTLIVTLCNKCACVEMLIVMPCSLVIIDSSSEAVTDKTSFMIETAFGLEVNSRRPQV